ncbi:Dos2-interacting transcription regulator of RNA-Pol-II-domain-containing protein [Choanephora cucurbitarum]|nr:Dos2-interacting transcription regulator of RNA-Pol-II-domain-containing protein [Choanephora cucurbitarum]
MDKCIREYMSLGNKNANTNQVLNKLLDFVCNKSAKVALLELIQHLSVYLANEDNDLRLRAITMLSHIIKRCDQEDLDESTTFAVVSLYCDCLHDEAIVPGIVPGLAVLTNEHQHFNKKCVHILLESLTNEVQVQEFPHCTRHTLLQIFENLLKYYCDDVKSWSDIYISGFVKAISGEKDPRNLMTVYSTVLKMTRQLDISDYAENLFAAISCYFPITFKSSSEHAYGVTAKDLKSSLRKCMASTPLFSDYALPLLLQKLTTTSGSAKKDTIESLTACIPTYPANDFFAIGAKLLNAIKIELFNDDPDPSLKEPSLEAIKAIAKVTTVDPKRESDALSVLKYLVNDCIQLLSELNERNVKPSSLVLRAIASASPFAYCLVENAVMAKLLRQYEEKIDISDRYLLLCTMIALIQARKTVYGTSDRGEEPDPNETNHSSILFSHKRRIIDIFVFIIKQPIEHTEVHMMATLGLGQLCVLKNYLRKDERTFCVQELSKILQREHDRKLRASVETSLSEIATLDSTLISNITMPILMKCLPEFSSNESSGLADLKPTFESVQNLCTSFCIYRTVEHDLLQKFMNTCSHNKDQKYAFEIISTLLKLIQARENESRLSECAKNLVHNLISSTASAAKDTTITPGDAIILNLDIVETISLIIQAVFRNMNEEEQKEYAIKIFKYFKDGDLSEFGMIFNNDINFCPLSANTSNAQAACVPIFAAMISAVHSNELLPIESEARFLDFVVNEALRTTRETQLVSFCRILASILNKWKSTEDRDNYIQSYQKKLKICVENENSNSALALYIWTTKALVIQSHKDYEKMTDMILHWMNHPVIGKKASYGFDVLTINDLLCLNKQCFANVSLLYKQKFAGYALPKLLDVFSKSITKEERSNSLVATVCLLKNMPKSVLLDQFPPVRSGTIRSN